MKKLVKKTLSLCLVLLITAIPIPAVASNASTSPSAWAQKEVKQAIELGIVPIDLQKDYQKDVTRAEFTEVVLYFLGMQFNYGEVNDFTYICFTDKGRQEPKYKSNYKNFTDTSDMDTYINEAHGLGIVNGRGDGTFDLGGYVTRQEAAKILSNTYSFYGGIAEHKKTLEDLSLAFSDYSTTGSWAQDSILYMWEWGVIAGVKNGLLDPLGHMTREQCIVTYLRLYEHAPISRALGNITPLVSYEDELQYQDYIEYPITELKYQQETDDCMVLSGISGGLPHGDAYCAIYLIFRSGGYRKVFIPLNSERFHLSENKKTLFFTDKVQGKNFAVDLQTAKVTETM